MKKLIAIFSILILPIIWFAPLFGAGVVPFFKLDEVSIITGLGALWEKDKMLFALITIFVIIFPTLKAIGNCLWAFGKHFPSQRVIFWLARLSLLDLFLIAVTIIAVKGVGIGRIEIMWGFGLFVTYVVFGYIQAIKKTDDL